MGMDVKVRDNTAVTGWQVSDSKDNAAATATKAAATGRIHCITTILASYSAAKTGLLQIKDGTTVIAEFYVVNSAVINLPQAIAASKGAAISVGLAASGTAGALGKVTILGFTL